MRNLLITGAGPRSFVGRNLKEALAQKYTVFAPSHAELELLDAAALEEYIRQNRIEAIVHAAVHVPMFNGEEKEYYNDMRMFLNMERVTSMVEKVVYFGSGAEFDKRYDITLVSEEDIGKSLPLSEYGLAKYTMNLIARSSANLYNLRLFGVFGKYELWPIKFISNLCCKAIFNLPLTVRKDCNFDFLYVEDLVAPLEWVLESSPLRHDYNLCHGTPWRLTQLAQMVKEVSGTSAEVVLLNEMKDLDYTGNNSLLFQECDNFSLTAMEKAIEHLYQYYYECRDSIDFNLLKESR